MRSFLSPTAAAVAFGESLGPPHDSEDGARTWSARTPSTSSIRARRHRRAVTVTATVTDDSGVASVLLYTRSRRRFG